MSESKTESIEAMKRYISRWQTDLANLYASGNTVMAKEMESLVAEAEKILSELDPDQDRAKHSRPH